MHGESTVAIEQAGQVLERAADIDVRYVQGPMFKGMKGAAQRWSPSLTVRTAVGRAALRASAHGKRLLDSPLRLTVQHGNFLDRRVMLAPLSHGRPPIRIKS